MAYAYCLLQTSVLAIKVRLALLLVIGQKIGVADFLCAVMKNAT